MRACRVCILQGPVAVAFSQTVDEPVASILGGIHDGWVRALAPAAAPSPVQVLCDLEAGGNLAALPAQSWLRVALSSSFVVAGLRLVPNPLPALFGDDLRVAPDGRAATSSQAQLGALRLL